MDTSKPRKLPTFRDTITGRCFINEVAAEEEEDEQRASHDQAHRLHGLRYVKVLTREDGLPPIESGREDSTADLYAVKDIVGEKIRLHLRKILDCIPTDWVRERGDPSVYTGGTGIACAYLLATLSTELSSASASPASASQASVSQASVSPGPGSSAVFPPSSSLLSSSQSISVSKTLLKQEYTDEANRLLRKASQRAPSLLCGAAGLFFTQSLMQYAVASSGPSSSPSAYEATCRSVQKYLSICGSARIGSLDSDEWLYGRTGYLYGLLFLSRKLIPLLRRHQGSRGPDSENMAKLVNDVDIELNNAINAIANDVVTSGVSNPGTPLFYQWHKQMYIGAAHGYFGILAVLLNVDSTVSNKAAVAHIRTTLDWLLSLETKHHNWPPSVEGFDRIVDRDYLVHFCHGAPGAVFCFSKAYQIFGDEKFKDAALRAGECVWKHGILRKGFGLCHGISGNGYVLLSLYKLTKDPIWLDRATYFALCLQDPFVIANSRRADNPCSFFEGLAGVIPFLIDLLSKPHMACYPLFEL